VGGDDWSRVGAAARAGLGDGCALTGRGKMPPKTEEGR